MANSVKRLCEWPFQKLVSKVIKMEGPAPIPNNGFVLIISVL